MKHTINVFGVWTDVAPDKFVLMLQRFKTGGLVGVHWVSLWFGWWMQEGLWMRYIAPSDAAGFRRLKPILRRNGLHRHQRP